MELFDVGRCEISSFHSPFPLDSSSRLFRCCSTLSMGTSSAPSNSPPTQSPSTAATSAPLNRDKDAGPPAATALTAVIAIHPPVKRLTDNAQKTLRWSGDQAVRQGVGGYGTGGDNNKCRLTPHLSTASWNPFGASLTPRKGSCRRT